MANSKGVTGRKACTIIRAAFCLAFFTYLCCSKVTCWGINFLCIFWTRFQACQQQMSVFLRLSKKVNIIVAVEWTTKVFEKKKPEKNSGLTGNQTLTFPLARHNVLSIELIKLAGEQTVVTELPWLGKSQGKRKFFKVREKSGNSVFWFIVHKFSSRFWNAFSFGKDEKYAAKQAKQSIWHSTSDTCVVVVVSGFCCKCFLPNSFFLFPWKAEIGWNEEKLSTACKKS